MQLGWPQLDQENQKQWVNNLLVSFQEGLIDYTILTYQKPLKTPTYHPSKRQF